MKNTDVSIALKIIHEKGMTPKNINLKVVNDTKETRILELEELKERIEKIKYELSALEVDINTIKVLYKNCYKFFKSEEMTASRNDLTAIEYKLNEYNNSLEEKEKNYSKSKLSMEEQIESLKFKKRFIESELSALNSEILKISTSK